MPKGELLESLMIELDLDTTKFSVASERINTGLTKSNKLFKEFERATKLDPKNTDNYKNAISQLRDTIDKSKEKLHAFNKASQELKDKLKADGVLEGSATYEKYAQDVEQQLQRAKNSIQSYQNKMNGLANQTLKLQLDSTGLGKVSTYSDKLSKRSNELADKMKFVSATAAGALFEFGKVAFTFEDAFANVTKTVDGTSEQLNGLKHNIIEMSKTMPISTEALANIMALGGQLGIQTDNLEKFTDTIAKVSVATNMSSEESATMFAQFSNITNMSQADIDKMASTIVYLGNNFATTEKDVINMAMNLAAAGEQAGFD
jgi:tRNA G46 methylase TrmB